jgi:predicted nucleotidyltransferase
MSCVTQEIYEWLASAFVPVSSTLLHAAVFGSVAAGSSHPGDCDVVLVSAADPDSDNWHALRASIVLLRSDFLQYFGIPLSIVLLTTSEWEETKGFFICQVPLFD